MSIEAMLDAAKTGNVKAQMTLGVCYDIGKHVDRDLEQAAYWYRQAAEQGFAPAQFNLAEMLREGAGVQQSASEAFHWYEKAAIQGNGKAMYNVAMMYVSAEGVEANNLMAYAWLSVARGTDAESVEQALAIVAKGIGSQTEDGDRIADDLRKKIAIHTS
ncbi:tetratricopeptide repeat protein [Bremerella cremea]|uniref:tetratricopeptide repeat protein n=1 Tax=Bremerella cremea TaxID=1031537 RepID=UPI0031EC0200